MALPGAISRYVPYTDYRYGNLSDWQYRFWSAAVRVARHLQNTRLQKGRTAQVSLPPALFPYPHVVRALRMERQPQMQTPRTVEAVGYSGRTVWKRRVDATTKTPAGNEAPKSATTMVQEGGGFHPHGERARR